ncbi:amidohydrolase family protein [bacterium]|nr:amidohydrolase family protein [bacterium]
MIKLLENCQIYNFEGNLLQGNILISGENILAVLRPNDAVPKNPDLTVNLEGRIVFPGLINSHDHLYHSFWPPCGNAPYRNWFEWEKSFRSTSDYNLKQKLSVADLYALGMYRNVISGVSMVVDHFPKEITESFLTMPHVGFLEDFYLAHSVSSHALEWGKGIIEEFKNSRGILPFVIHVEEGFDPEIQTELETLCRMGVLAENTVLVNGLGFSKTDVEMVASKGSSVVWTPSSNAFLYQRDAPIASMLDAGVKLALGTDCTLVGSTNLLDEIRLAREFSAMHLGGRIKDLDLISMVTINAAKIFHIDKTYGSIQPGKKADLLIFEDFKNNPLESFFALTPKDISLLVRKGVMVYGEDRFRSVCSLRFDQFSEVLVNRNPKLLWGKPLELLDRIEFKLGERRKFPFLPVSEV